MSKDILRQLPSVDHMLMTEEAEGLIEKYGREMVVHAARQVIDELRSEILKAERESQGDPFPQRFDPEWNSRGHR